jgi:hypothetical protein
MLTFAQKPKLTKQISSAVSAKPSRVRLGLGDEASWILHLQRTIGNRAVQRLLEAATGVAKGDSTHGEIASHDPDLMHAVASETASLEAPPTTAMPRVNDGPTTARDTNHADRAGNDMVPVAHDFSAPRIIPIWASGAPRPLHADVPTAGANEEEIVDLPGNGGTTNGAPTATASDSCGQPTSMDKVTSGAFLGGLTINSYYPDLASRGYPTTAGPFDLGNRVGASVQLYGAVPSPCSPDQFHLEQTITRTRYRHDGAVHREEGKTFDDLAKSGRDVVHAPFRQEFLGGGTAPLGYIISMADPPSTGYDSTSNIEHDRDFVTSLVGPTGRQSVTWSLSTRIAKGVVTSNVLS